MSAAKDANYPFIANCKSLTCSAPFHWLKLGFQDFKNALPASLLIGAMMAALMMGVAGLTWRYGSAWIMFSLLCGFVFLAPIACVALYAISAQLERGSRASLIRAIRACGKRYLGSEMVFALMLLVVFLVWARASTMASVFLPIESSEPLSGIANYIIVIVTISLLFLSLTFALSVFSLPMIMHRDVDAVTAVVSSINAVMRNKLVMGLWGMILASTIAAGVLTLGLLLIVVLPVIGYAVWHGYLETIDASPFPRHKDGITAIEARPR